MSAHTQTVDVSETTAFITRTMNVRIRDVDPQSARRILMLRYQIIRRGRQHAPVGERRYAVDIERMDRTWNTHIVFASDAAAATVAAFLDEIDKGYDLSGESRVRISE
ncbi:MAG TPA: hypothetical protein PLW14_03070 [Chlorobiota bacterium]|nr:hypothetical protein [Chlorobiota bacterium]